MPELVDHLSSYLRGYIAGLSDATVASISRCFDLVRYPSGHLLMKQGAPGDSMYLILTGEVEVRRHPLGRGGEVPDVVVARLSEGDVVGEMALVVNQPRSADVVTLTDTLMYRLTKDGWIMIGAQNPTLAETIERIARARLEENVRFGPDGTSRSYLDVSFYASGAVSPEP